MVGNLTSDPELKMLPSGTAVCNIRLAGNDRRYNKQTGAWESGDSIYLSAVLWREQAENAAESLSRGDQVIVTGKLEQRSYEAKDGSGTRQTVELAVDHIGPSLMRAVAKPQRANSAPATAAAGWGVPAADEPAW